MFRFTTKPSSGSHSRYLAKITPGILCVVVTGNFNVYRPNNLDY